MNFHFKKVVIFVICNLICLLIFVGSKKYNRELLSARIDAEFGNTLNMEKCLTFAQWDAEEHNVDIQKRIFKIRVKGYKNTANDSLREAVMWATYIQSDNTALFLMNKSLDEYRANCLRAGLQLDENKISKIKQLYADNKNLTK